MDYEWDEQKRRDNIRKHGVDFADAVQILERDNILFEDTRCDYGERRYIAIGELNGFVLFVVFTLRTERCRIISARRATRKERTFYYENY